MSSFLAPSHPPPPSPSASAGGPPTTSSRPATGLAGRRRKRTLMEPCPVRVARSMGTPKGRSSMEEAAGAGTAGSPATTAMEASVHELSPANSEFIPLAFPGLAAMASAKGGRLKLRVVVTFQPAGMDIMERNDRTEAERKRLFLGFSAFAEQLSTQLRSSGPAAFADYADMDGGAMLTERGASMFNEVEIVRAALGYRLTSVGGVTIVVHPRWGTNVYVGSVVTASVEPEVLVSTLRQFAVNDNPIDTKVGSESLQDQLLPTVQSAGAQPAADEGASSAISAVAAAAGAQPRPAVVTTTTSSAASDGALAGSGDGTTSH